MHVRGISIRRQEGNRWWIVLTAVVLFAGLFLQITMLSRVSSVSKRASVLEAETTRLKREADNLELRVNEAHNLELLAGRARELGMVQPDETQIRAVQVKTAAARSLQEAIDGKDRSAGFPGVAE